MAKGNETSFQMTSYPATQNKFVCFLGVWPTRRKTLQVPNFVGM